MPFNALSSLTLRRMVISLPMLVALALPMAARAATTEEVLRAVEDQRREALRIQDWNILGRIYAPEFVGVTANGEVINRTQLFQSFAKGNSAQKFSTEEIKVLDLGETAIFFGRLVARAPTGAVTYSTRFSHVFVKRDSVWWCVSGQSTSIAEP